MTQAELDEYRRLIETIIDADFMDGLIQHLQEKTSEFSNLSNIYYIPPNMRAIFLEMINWTIKVCKIKDYQIALALIRKLGPEWMAMKRQFEYDLYHLTKVNGNVRNLVEHIQYNSKINPYVLNKEFFIPPILYEDIL
jgi:hydroxypyruvate isomerase